MAAAAAAACRSSYRCVSTLARKCIIPAAATTTPAPNSCSQLVQGARRPSLWRPHGRRHFAAATARPRRQEAAEHTAAEPSSSRLLQLQQRLAHEGGVAAAKSSKPARRRAKVATPVAPHTVVDWRRLAQLGRQALTDGYGRFHNYLRISLTERCNLRCKYCMPAEGVEELTPSPFLLSSEEIVRIATVFVAAGVTKIRLTGGEPLVRRDVVELCEQLGALPGLETLAVTTNGLLLPRKLPRLAAAGLDTVNISLDTLDPAKFTDITRRPGFDRVMKAIHASIDAGLTVKVNCVVMRGLNETEVTDFVQLTQDLPIDVRFIEYMPFDDNQWNDANMVSYDEMLGMIRDRFPTLARISDAPNDTSKGYTVPGHAGKIGFITSMTENFCSTCNRVRMTADGNLKVCLFGSEEVSLRDAMREGATDEDLAAVVAGAVGAKHAALGGKGDMYGIAASKNRPMITIGG